MPLAFGAALERSFEVSDGSDVESVIRIKATRPKELAEELRRRGFEEFVLGTRLCLPEEKIIRGEMPERSDYFSVLLARRRKMKVYFVGAGPGDPDLITVKGKRLLEEADLVIFAGSLVNPALLEGLKAEKMDSNGAISGGHLRQDRRFLAGGQKGGAAA